MHIYELTGYSNCYTDYSYLFLHSQKNIMSPKSLMVLLICSVVFTTSCKEKLPHLVVSNPGALEQTDALVVLKRSELTDRVGATLPGKYLLLTDSAGRPVLVQYDDLDDDGQWDELVFLSSLPANGTKQFEVAIADRPATMKAVVRAHVRHMKKNADNSFGPDLESDTMPENQQPTDFAKTALSPYLAEGPAWENDKVGFRIYFDIRNGKDIWGKTTAAMVLDEVGADTAKNYHQQAEWGMDILKVGNSLGAGSLALSFPLNGKDTLVKLGGANISSVVYEKLSDGPIRAAFRLSYKNWKVAEDITPVQLTEEISIWGGQYMYTSKVTVTGAPANAALVTGLVNLHNLPPHDVNSSIAKALFTWGVQSENNDALGLAIIVPSQSFNSFDSVGSVAGSGIQNTYMVKQTIAQEPLTYRFYSAWSKSDDRFKAKESFEQFIRKEAVYANSPLTVEWK
jgi:Domain of unknown function (DUF4861)